MLYGATCDCVQPPLHYSHNICILNPIRTKQIYLRYINPVIVQLVWRYAAIMMGDTNWVQQGESKVSLPSCTIMYIQSNSACVHPFTSTFNKNTRGPSWKCLKILVRLPFWWHNANKELSLHNHACTTSTSERWADGLGSGFVNYRPLVRGNKNKQTNKQKKQAENSKLKRLLVSEDWSRNLD